MRVVDKLLVVIETDAWSDHVIVAIEDSDILDSVHLSTCPLGSSQFGYVNCDGGKRK